MTVTTLPDGKTIEQVLDDLRANSPRGLRVTEFNELSDLSILTAREILTDIKRVNPDVIIFRNVEYYEDALPRIQRAVRYYMESINSKITVIYGSILAKQ